MTSELVTRWPAMSVKPKHFWTALKTWETADEHATGDLTFDDGTGIRFADIDLPPTPVAVHHGILGALLSGDGEIATVAACVANGSEPEATIRIELDTEPVVLEKHKLVAKAMPATATVTLANGEVWSSRGVEQPEGYGGFPDCAVVNGVAQPIEARFRLEKVQ